MVFATPEAAEIAFYSAFESRSLDDMMRVWAQTDQIVCIHPLAAALNGRGAVAAGWRSIFEAAAQFSIGIQLAHEIRETDQVVRIVYESLTIGHETEPRPPILATNLYRREADGWHMVLHHASPMQAGGTPPARTPPPILH
ncbi:MAG: YybH family protein [Thiobacillus sp.]